MPAMTTPPPQSRLASIDAYRGFVMLLMLAEVLRFPQVAKALPESAFWQFLAFHQSHVSWVGCSLHDLIQPSFSFLVGVACVFSLAKRWTQQAAWWTLPAHTLFRAAVLMALGVWLRFKNNPGVNWTFEDTLAQIGLGYPLLVWLGLRSVRVQLVALVVILVGYWAVFVAHPLPTPDTFDYPTVGVPDSWPENPTGFAGHWAKNSNAAWAFDVWFLNLFPRDAAFKFNRGGYSTLSFIPTLGTMVLGLLAGGVLKDSGSHRRKLGVLTAAGVGLLAAGYALGWLGVCPVVKRIWTPTWVLFSGGWCSLLLAGFYALTDAVGRAGWSLPLRVVGANSILAYLSEWLLFGPLRIGLYRLLGDAPFKVLGDAYEPLLSGAAILTVTWLGLYVLYRNRLFLRI
jgi:predicted acyltransferase